MKKKSALLMFFMMPIVIFSANAWSEYAPYEEDMSIYYSSLTRDEQELYDIIYEGVLDYEKVIDLPHGYDIDTVDKVVSIMMDDSPELFWLDHSWASSYYESNPEIALDVEIDYIMSEDEAIRRWDGIIDFYDSIEFEWDSDLMDELYIIDAIIENTEYVDGIHVYDASSSLVSGEAVCEGYAKAAALLLRFHGIPAGVVGGVGYSDGEGEAHAWNIVQIGGEWTLLDITWIDEDEASYYDWINLSAEQFSKTHYPENAPYFYDSATDTYEIARLLELYSQGNSREYFLSQLELLIEEDIPLLIYYESPREYRYVLSHYDQWMDEYNYEMGDKGFYGDYVVATDEDRLRFYLDRD